MPRILQFLGPHGERVIAWFGARGLVCYNLAGELQWTKSLGPFQYQAGWRSGSSPILLDDVVIIQCDNDDGMVFKEDYFEALGATEDKDRWMKSIDKNHDGRFDFAEFSTGNHRTDPVAMFLNLDTDLDGLLSLREMESLPEWWRQMAKFSFKGFADDHDGAISLREYQLMPHSNLLAAWTEVVDQDHDGKLTALRVGSGIYLSALAAEYFRRLNVDRDHALSLNEFQFVSNFRPIRTIEGWADACRVRSWYSLPLFCCLAIGAGDDAGLLLRRDEFVRTEVERE